MGEKKVVVGRSAMDALLAHEAQMRKDFPSPHPNRELALSAFRVWLAELPPPTLVITEYNQSEVEVYDAIVAKFDELFPDVKW